MKRLAAGVAVGVLAACSAHERAPTAPAPPVVTAAPVVEPAPYTPTLAPEQSGAPCEPSDGGSADRCPGEGWEGNGTVEAHLEADGTPTRILRTSGFPPALAACFRAWVCRTHFKPVARPGNFTFVFRVKKPDGGAPSDPAPPVDLRSRE